MTDGRRNTVCKHEDISKRKTEYEWKTPFITFVLVNSVRTYFLAVASRKPTPVTIVTTNDI